MHRVRLSGLTLAARSAAAAPLCAPLPTAVAASCVSVQPRRCMSAGSRRDNKKGIPERRAGGITLPGEGYKDVHGKKRYKSAREMDRDSKREDRADMYTGAGQSTADKRAAHKEYQDEQKRLQEEYEEVHGSVEDRRAVESVRREFAQHQSEREPLRRGEQSWREQQLLRAGIPQQADFKAERIEKLTKADERGVLRSSANPQNPSVCSMRIHVRHFPAPLLVCSWLTIFRYD